MNYMHRTSKILEISIPSAEISQEEYYIQTLYYSEI